MLLTRPALIAEFASARLQPVAVETIRQIVANGSRQYADRIALRAYSDLLSIPDQKFLHGLASLREHMASSDDAPIEEVIDLFVFRAECG